MTGHRVTHLTGFSWRRALLMVGALFVTFQFARAQTSSSAPTASGGELEGLWKAKRWFGPFARGPLVLQRTGMTYTADMIGRILPVRVEKGELSFELPNGEGLFRGKLQPGAAIRGQWYPPGSMAFPKGSE